MRHVIRRWLARQFQPDRRSFTCFQLLSWGFVAFTFASPHIWRHRSQIDWEQEWRVTREASDQAERIEDLAERQRALQALQARTSRLQTLALGEAQEGLRRSRIQLRATKYAIAILFLASVPMMIDAAREARRRRWLKSGRCGGCGYDLRESPARCPECGRDTPAPAV